MRQLSKRTRPVGAVDIASSAIARVAPRALTPIIDRARHDVRSILDGLSGRREPSSVRPSSPRFVPVPLASIDPIEHALPRGEARRRWVTLRTDVAWLLRDLRGEPRPTKVVRGPSRYAKQPERPRGLGAALRELRVTSIVRETDDALSVTLTEIDGAPIAFEAGQFLTFHLDVDGARVRRAYSLSSSPLSGIATITVKRIEGGRASGWLHEHLREGDTLRALGPSGSFLAPAARAPMQLVMIAGGSGITPVISIAETVLESRPELSVALVYGSRRARDMIFADRLASLAARHPERFEVTHVLSDPDASWTGPRGLLDRGVIEDRIDAIADRGPRLYYLCGPAPMMDAAREALALRGVSQVDIREERFQSPADSHDEPLPSGPMIARVKVGGRDHVVRVDPGQTLLEAGLAAGARLPFSCAMGGCGACRVKLVSGTVQLDEPTCLSPREREAGYVLACSSRPTSAVAIEVER